MAAMGGGEVFLLPGIKCQKKPEMRGWDGLPRIAVSCQEILEIGGGEGLPGATVTSKKMMDMGGNKIIRTKRITEQPSEPHRFGRRSPQNPGNFSVSSSCLFSGSRRVL